MREAAIVALTAVTLAVAGPAAAAQSAGNASSPHSSGTAEKVDPAQLIDPDTAATAIEVKETPHFHSIRVVPVARSGNSKALIDTVLANDAGRDQLHAAIRGNAEMMKALDSRHVDVADVIAVTTDRNDNAIVYTR